MSWRCERGGPSGVWTGGKGMRWEVADGEVGVAIVGVTYVWIEKNVDRKEGR